VILWRRHRDVTYAVGAAQITVAAEAVGNNIAIAVQ
jgi:hypothetical protein